VKTFIFGDLPPEEKMKFMEFMISNNVDFSQDPQDGMFVATIRIVNKVNGSSNIKAYEEQKEEYQDTSPSLKQPSSNGSKNNSV